jgi:hypothetical protein
LRVAVNVAAVVVHELYVASYVAVVSCAAVADERFKMTRVLQAMLQLLVALLLRMSGSK